MKYSIRLFKYLCYAALLIGLRIC